MNRAGFHALAPREGISRPIRWKLGHDLLALLVEHEVIAGSRHTQLLQTYFRDINAVRGLHPKETAVFVPSQDIE
jgi:hypothetical protein